MSVGHQADNALLQKPRRVKDKSIVPTPIKFKITDVGFFEDGSFKRLPSSRRDAGYCGVEYWVHLIAASRQVGQIMNGLTTQAWVSAASSEDGNIMHPAKSSVLPVFERIGEDRLVSAYVYNMAKTNAGAAFSGDHKKSTLIKGERSLPNYRTDGTHPISVQGNGVRVIRHCGRVFVVASIFESGYAAANGMRKDVAFAVERKAQTDPLRNRVLTEAVDDPGCICYFNVSRKKNHKGEWEEHGLLCSRVQPGERPVLLSENVLGVDVGVAHPVVMHARLGCTKDNPFGDPVAYEAFACGKMAGSYIYKSKSSLSAQRRVLGALGRGGRGLHLGPSRVSAKNKYRRIADKESRLVVVAARAIASHVGKFAAQHGCGTWQIEDLCGGNGIKSGGDKFSDWPLSVILDAIKMKASRMGASVVLVNPSYTSQRCSNCGHIDKLNRPSRDVFKCLSCGYKNHSDKNAARNLSVLGVDKIIKSHIGGRSK